MCSGGRRSAGARCSAQSTPRHPPASKTSLQRAVEIDKARLEPLIAQPRPTQLPLGPVNKITICDLAARAQREVPALAFTEHGSIMAASTVAKNSNRRPSRRARGLVRAAPTRRWLRSRGSTDGQCHPARAPGGRAEEASGATGLTAVNKVERRISGVKPIGRSSGLSTATASCFLAPAILVLS